VKRKTDIRVRATRLYFLPVTNRVPLKFGTETVTSVTCARGCVTVEEANGRRAEGWGETPLSVQWVWPGALPYETRHEAMKRLCVLLAEAWAGFSESGHPIEIGHAFQAEVLPGLTKRIRQETALDADPLPHLAALVCCSVFDLAVHDAYGNLHNRPIYSMYSADWMNRDLSAYLEPAADFRGKYPADFLVKNSPKRLPAWHLVGGLDLLEPSELTGNEPKDGYPVLLRDWIGRDGLKCLKIKLRGSDRDWDYQRLVNVGRIAIPEKVEWLTADFNCTVREAKYVNSLLDRLQKEHPAIHKMILYVEQPFPYDLEANPIDVHSVSERKPLFLDESAHDWRLVRLGRELGWTGVALKTCKTQTGALLAGCWSKAHGMSLMVQDLTNPMLAQISHVLLAANVGTIMGVETNSMQFYPEASAPEAAVHPGLYRRKDGQLELSSIHGPGFGYRLSEIKRTLPPPAAEFEAG